MRNFETVLMELPRRFERKFMGCRRAGNVRVSEPVQHARLPQVTPAGGEAFSSLGGQPGGRKPGRSCCGFWSWLPATIFVAGTYVARPRCGADHSA